MGSSQNNAEYLFGDSSNAAARLRLLAHVFSRSTREFLAEAVDGPAALAVDLGCGPGFTTRLLVETGVCRRAIGIDTSRRFISKANSATSDSARFLVHDVTRMPMPVAGADLFFCRFLLTHMPNPEQVMRSWFNELPRGGLLLIEEPERIDTSAPVFVRYLEMLNVLMAEESRDLFVGRRLAAIELPPDVRATLNHEKRVAVADRDAASMFRMNLETWQQRPYVRRAWSADELRLLGADLEAVASGPAKVSHVTWGLRQIALRKISP